MPVPFVDCFDHAERSCCDGTQIDIAPHPADRLRATGISWKDVRAGKVFATVKLDTRSERRLITPTRVPPIPQNAVWRDSTD